VITGQHEHHSIHEQCHPAGLPECETLKKPQDGLALDRSWHVRSKERLTSTSQFSSKPSSTTAKRANVTRSRTPHNLQPSTAAQASFNKPRDIPPFQRYLLMQKQD
jgi:hypothetical protein